MRKASLKYYYLIISNVYQNNDRMGSYFSYDWMNSGHQKGYNSLVLFSMLPKSQKKLNMTLSRLLNLWTSVVKAQKLRFTLGTP